MKTKATIAALVLTAIAVYLIRKRRKPDPEPVKRSHHLTDVFARAKQAAV